MAGPIRPVPFISTCRNETASGSLVVDSSSSPMRARISCDGSPSTSRSRNVRKKYDLLDVLLAIEHGHRQAPRVRAGRLGGTGSIACRACLGLEESRATAACISRSSRWTSWASSRLPWSRSGTISTTASLPSMASESLKQLDRPFEVKRIQVAGDHVKLALELGAERRPVSLEDQPDVIGFPSLRDIGVDRAGGAVPELARAAVASSGLKTASNEPSWLPQPTTSSIREKRS